MFELLFKEPPSVWREASLLFESGWSVGALGAAVALAALAIVLSLVRAPLGGGRRLVLGLLQIVAAAVALTMLWRPALELERTRAGENAVAWLIDVSASMQTPDADGGTARRDALRRALEADDLIDDERFAPRIVAFGEETRALDALDALDSVPPAPLSDVAGALESVLGGVGEAALAAVVLASDGADNVGGADARWWQRIAAAGVPVHVVGVGSEHDADDVELADVRLPRASAADAPVRARLRIVHGGGGTARLRVSDGETLLYADDVALDADAGETVVEVGFDAGEAGLKRLDFVLSGEASEANLANNRQTRVLDVRAAPRRILYVEGEPRWEYKFLRRAVHDHPGIEIASLLRTSPNKFYRQGVRDAAELAEGFPTTREALFAYEAVIIGSLAAAELDARQQAALRDFVAVRGGSLLMLAGRQGLADGGWARSGVAAALPVTLSPRLDARTYRRERVRALPTRQGLRSEWLRLGEGEATEALAWSDLPELSDHQRLGSPKPGARVLVETAGGEPLLVAQRYGRGSSFVLGTSGTWRWQMRLPSEDLRHERFWRSLLGELVARAPARIEFERPPAVVRDVDSVVLALDARASDYTPLGAATLVARVTTPEGGARRLELVADPAVPGRYRGTLALDADGPWGVAVTTPPEGESPAVAPVTVETWLLRESGNAEAFGARQQRPFLERIAASTGGRYLALGDVDELPAVLEADNAALTRAEILPLWNMPFFFVLLILAKGGEWMLRLLWKRL